MAHQVTKGLMVLVGMLAMTAAMADTGSRQIAGVWWAEKSTPRLMPSDGGALPFTSEGRAHYQKNIIGLKGGAIVDEAVHTCVPEGIPRALSSAYPFQIIVTQDQVTFVHEANRAYRMVALTDKHADPDEWDPSFMGEGIAHWEGDELVIDSTNFKAVSIYLDSSGLPASEKLHVIERIKLEDAGKELEDQVTIDDPVIFSKPWSSKFVFQRRDDVRLKTDWVCGERHRDLSIPEKTATSSSGSTAAPALTPGQTTLSGYWHNVLPPGVPFAPTPPDVLAKLQPATATKFKSDEAASAAGQFVGSPYTECMPAVVGGTGSSGGLAYSAEILVEPRQVTFLYELNRIVHFAYIGGRLPTHSHASWQGTSVAHWEGDTLVIDTIGFNGKSMLMLGTNPMLRTIDTFPFSSKMHVVERYKILPNGQLEDVATFDDPVAFTAPFKLTSHFIRARPFQEFICAENNHEGGVPTSNGGTTGFTVPKGP